jgi:hypothetical protein
LLSNSPTELELSDGIIWRRRSCIRMRKFLGLTACLGAVAISSVAEAGFSRPSQNSGYPVVPNADSLVCYAQTEDGTTVDLTQLCGQVQQVSNCSPAYPNVCISPSSSGLTCKDISYRNFQVLPPDPYQLDRDKDGIGCEPYKPLGVL